MGAAKETRVSKGHPKPVRATAVDLHALVDASDDAIIGKAMDGTILSWNKGAQKIYGYEADEVLGQPISLLIAPGHPDELPKIMKRLQRGEHIKSFETTRICKDGHLVDVSLTISPMKRGGVVVGASVVARDITKQKVIHEALCKTEERFRVALKNAPVAVFSQDLRLRYTWVNLSAPRYRKYLGCTDAEIFGGEDGARLTAIKEEVLRTGIESHSEIALTFEGEKRYFDLVVQAVHDAKGKPLGLLSTAVETTALEETIARLQQALDEIHVLRGLLPMCASCKRIKDEHETWQVLEVYLQNHTEAKFTHGICPECMRKLYPEYSN